MAESLQRRLAVACVAALASGACTGVRQHPDAGGTGAAGMGMTGASGTNGAAGNLYTPSDAGGPDLYVGGLPDVGPVERVVGSAPLGDAACAAQTQKAERLPLDIYVMLDSSASMTGATAGRQTKWDAVRAALTSFVRDQSSAGLGVGLQYFPLIRPGAPISCTSNAMCGAAGPCDMKGCTNSNTLKFCQTNADCGAGGSCAQVGICSLAPTYFCLAVGTSCGGGGGRCNAPLYNCHGRDLCDSASYATPAVEVAPLPGAANALISSLTAHMPDGLTPTSGALKGAIEHAQALSKASGHRVVVLLATDGIPIECDPTDIPGVSMIAAGGLAGTPSISTFVIGVFGTTDRAMAQLNLDTIAAAGGTKQAFVIDVGQNVAQEFLTALNSVRTAALSCEFKVPTPAAGETLDYYQVNVQYTSGAGQAVTIGNVSSKAACDARKGGWYYDVDPATGAKPTNISICDTSCTQLRGDAAGRVDVLLGCKTEIVVP
jgi:hypothetical protein